VGAFVELPIVEFEELMAEKKKLERQLVEQREALNEVGPLMEQAMANPLWGSLQGGWKARALSWHKKHNKLLREVAALSRLEAGKMEE
jgi:hypothetical protein